MYCINYFRTLNLYLCQYVKFWFKIISVNCIRCTFQPLHYFVIQLIRLVAKFYFNIATLITFVNVILFYFSTSAKIRTLLDTIRR